VTLLTAQFWRLYASSTVSNLADGIGRTALPLLGATYTRNPILISGLVSFAFLPWLLFALPSGALVDRTDRRIALATANLVRAVTVGALALFVLTDTGSIGIVYVAAFLVGLAETVYDSASRAILPQVIDPRGLDRANGLLTVEETLGQTFVGAPLGSALFALTATLPFLLDAGGFAVAALVLLTLRGRYRPVRDDKPGSMRTEVREGVTWLVHHRFLRELTAVSGVSALCGSMISGVLVLYVLETLHLPAGDFGYVLLAAGAGGVLGGLTADPLARRIGRGPVLVVGGLLTGVTTIAMGCTHNGYLGAIAFGLSGAGVMFWNVLTMSLRQSLIPQYLFGRVQGAYRTVVWGCMPLGAILGGVIARTVSIPAVLIVAGAGLTGTGLWLIRVVIAHRALIAGDQVPASLSPAGAR
jgi:MFS family permease